MRQERFKQTNNLFISPNFFLLTALFMKKTLTLMLLALTIGMPLSAQEEIDVTDQYIVNAGFDEDLTFQIDGAMKEAISTETSLSDRSWAYIAADSSVYARPKSTSSQNRPDGRKLEAVNGFIGRTKGWTVASGSEFPKCEWVYFGFVPYDLREQSVPIADDGSTYMETPERPEVASGEDNVGFMYTRAGWGGWCTYSQEVRLPTANYRLEYWTKNFNTASTATATDLSYVEYRGKQYKEEGGEALSSTEWTMHEIEFVPVGSMKMTFGYQSANSGSGGNPWVAIDGIKLYYLGEADVFDILSGDAYDLKDEIVMEAEEKLGLYGGLLEEIQEEAENLLDKCDDAIDAENQSALEAIIAEMRTLQSSIDERVALGERFEQLLARADKALEIYPGLPGEEALSELINEYSSMLDESYTAAIKTAEEKLAQAINDFYLSQEATRERPANYTFLIQHPWFCKDDRVPASNAMDVIAEASLVDEDLNGEGWVDGSTASSKTTGTWTKLSRTCYQLWGTNFTGYMDVHQVLTGLPNGIYSLSADMITNTDSRSDQHIYATSTLGQAEGYMTDAGVCVNWPGGDYTGDYPIDGEDPWETVKTTTTVIVDNGTLTIGARSTHGEGEDYSQGERRGCFWVTNFMLYYYGAATEEEITQAYANRVNFAQQLQENMRFKGDRAAMADSIAAYDATKDITILNNGIAFAETSEAKYDEIMEEGKTIPTLKAALEVDDPYLTLGPAFEIVDFAYKYILNWLENDSASYRDVDAQLTIVKNYSNTYATAYNEADETLRSLRNVTAKGILNELMDKQKAILIADVMQPETVINDMVADLRSVQDAALLQEMYEQNKDAVDYTAFIKNPDIASEAGWTFLRGTGNLNTNVGQHYTGDTERRYIDSYNSTAGKLNFYAEQRINGLPNGTYQVKAAVRTNAPGAFLFTANGGAEKNDTTFTEIPLQHHKYETEEGVDTTVVASDIYGAIWEEAYVEVNEKGNTDPDVMAIYNANGSQGRGWEWLALDNVKVEDHVLVIGVTTDSLRTGKPFEGQWFSVTDWSLTLVEKGDNAGWDGPITAVEAVEQKNVLAVDGIFDFTGRRVSGTQKPGLYIVVTNGKARKVLVR